MALEAFRPSGTVTVSASTSSASATLAGQGDVALVYNATTGIAFVQFSTGTVTATAAGYPVPPSTTRIIKVGSLVSSVGVILSASSGNVYVTLGSGAQY